MFGATIAILCALIWSISVILFKKAGDEIHPILLNLYKSIVGFVLMVPTVLLVEGTTLPALATRDVLVLLASGAVGIGISDAMVLKALKDIGASRIAIVECSYSPFVIVLSLIFFGEVMTAARFVGAALVVAAIACVTIKRDAFHTDADPKRVARGFAWGIAGLFSMAIGILSVKPIFGSVPFFLLLAIRLFAGMVASGVLFAVLPRKKALIAQLHAVKHKGLVFLACLLSTYVSMILWIAGYKYNDATVTAVLNQTSTIFTVLLAALVLKERFTPLKLAGTALAFSGVLLITLG